MEKDMPKPETVDKEIITQEPENLNLEQALEQVEEMIAKLQDRETPLEESFQLYRRGMELLKQCGSQIDLIEKQVLKLSETGEVDPL